MAKITITNPQPSLRKCGGGQLVTSCARCGRLMLGHNRGLCSRCRKEVAK